MTLVLVRPPDANPNCAHHTVVSGYRVRRVSRFAKSEASGNAEVGHRPARRWGRLLARAQARRHASRK